MAERIIVPGPGGNGLSDTDLTPIQIFAREVETATNKVCQANVPVPFVIGILESVAIEVKFNAQMRLMQEQAEIAARAMEAAAKIKPS